VKPWLQVVLCFSLLGMGCHGSKVSGERYPSRVDFKPAAVRTDPTTLLLAGTPYPVTVKPFERGDDIRFDFVSHDEVFESELYEQTATMFFVIEAADERYVPAMPILRFPLTIGDSWKWEGEIVSSGISYKAGATITTGSEDLYFSGMKHHTVRVLVRISLEANPGKSPLERELTFWFEPGKGIIKREFGSASEREPSPW